MSRRAARLVHVLTATMALAPLAYAAESHSSKRITSCYNGSAVDNPCYTWVWTPGSDDYGVCPTTSGTPGYWSKIPCPDPDSGYTDHSYISTRIQSHIHSAFDYRIKNSSGCAPCGAVGAPSGKDPLRHLEIVRYLRQRNIGSGGSLGVGGYLSFDAQLNIVQDTSKPETAALVTFFDPSKTSIKMTLKEGSATDGVLGDDSKQFKSLTFRLADSTITPDYLQASTATLVSNGGQTLVFEVIRTSSNPASTARDARLTQIIDRNGNAEVIAYQFAPTATDTELGNDRAKLWLYTTVTDHFGAQATFSWSSAKIGTRYAITTIALPNGTNLTYSYTGTMLTGIAHPDGTSSSFSSGYDTAKQKTTYTWDDNAAGGTHMRKTLYVTGSSWTDPNTQQVYGQSVGLVVRVDNANNEMTFLEWAKDGDPNTRYLWSAGRGLVSYRTTGDGRVMLESKSATSYDLTQEATTYAFEPKWYNNTNNNIEDRFTTMTDGLGRLHRWSYETNTRFVTKYTAPDATTIDVTYNALGLPLTVKDRLGRVMTYTYDANGNCLTKVFGTGAEQSTWSWTYNSRGQVLSATDANGNVTDYVYNTAGYLVNVLEPADLPAGPRATREFQYDTAGRMTRSIDPDGRHADYTYDSRNRVTRISYGGNVNVTTDFEEITYGTTALTANLVTQKRDRNGNLTTYGYDNSSRQITMTQASSTADAVTSTTSYLGGTEKPVTRTAAGETTTYAYDIRTRLASTSVQPRTGTTLTTSFSYDIVNRRTGMTDAYGRDTAMVYDINDYVIRTVRELIPDGIPVGSTLSTLARVTTANPPYVISDATYNAEGEQLTQTDGRGIVSTMTYDTQGRLATQVQASSAPVGITALSYTTTYGYDAQGNTTTVTHPRTGQPGETGSFQTVTTYTGRNLVKTVTEAFGRTEAATQGFTYTLTGKRATTTDFRGNTTSFTYYPCCDRLKDVIEPGAFTTTYAYDFFGNVTSVTDANGNSTTTTYDARHRVKTVANAENETTTYAYDDNASDATGLSGTYASQLTGLGLGVGSDGSIVAVTNPANETSLQIRDGLGRGVRSVDGLGHATTTSYDTVTANLIVTSVTDALSHTQSSHVDGAGRVRVASDALNQQTTLSYDANGNRVSIRDANNVGQDCVYDAANRDTQCTDTASPPAITSRTYDAHSNVRTSTDALAQVTTCVFDGRDRKTQCTDRIAGLTAFAYDANNNLLTITDAELKVTTYAYDSRNLLTSETYPAGQATPGAGQDVRTYTYDAGRRLATRTDQTGLVTTYSYDDANRLLTRAYPDALNDLFTYDDASRLTNATSARFNTVVARAYDAASRLTSEQQTVGGYAYLVGYGYDDANRTTTITYPNNKQVAQTFTDRNQLASTSYDGQNISSFAYDNGGRTGTRTSGNGLIETRTHNGDNTVATLAVPGVTNFSYTFDASKRKTYEGHLFAADLQTFGYDNESRVTAWTRDGVESQGWLLSTVGDWQSTTRNGTTQTRTHSDVHETTSLTTGAVTTPLTYDQKGNLTQDEQGQQLRWDTENRLITAVSGAATNGYFYDALGRRLGKNANGAVTTFVHSGAQVIAEYEAPVYQSQDIGSPALAGSFSDSGTGTVTVAGAGNDIWSTSDQFRYAYFTLTGDGSITARVTSQTNTNAWAKAGVMLRDSLAANAKHALIAITPGNGVSFQSRTTTGGSCTFSAVAGQTAPKWVRLTRSGTTMTGAYSADGVTWTNVSSATITFGQPTIYAGLAVTSHNTAAISTATFTNVSTTGWVTTASSPAYARGYVYGSYVDELLAILPASGVVGDRKFVHSNHLYSVAALTDNSGAVVERYRYSAYGERTVLAADGVTTRTASLYGNQVGFTGRYLDKETGLWHFRARYYSGSLGRFVSADPLGYVDGMGLYAGYFVPNGLDPFGLQRINGPEATVVSWIAWTPIDKVRQGVLDAWINLYGPDNVDTTVSVTLAGATLALYSGYNPEPSASMTPVEYKRLLASREYRAASRLKPWIECECGIVLEHGREAKYSIGYTPQYPVPALRMPFGYIRGQGNSDVSAEAETSCVTFTMKTRFMVNEFEQGGYKLIYGRRLPYAWHEITYRLCCDETYTVEFNGSIFPSHQGYVDGVMKWRHDQRDYGKFAASGGMDPASDRDAPGINP